MSFFTQLAFMAGDLDLQITFKKKGENITIGVFPASGNSEVSERIKPILMTGTSAELDEGFFANLTPAMNKINGIITNINSVDEELRKLEEQKKGKVAGTKAKEAEPKKDKEKAVSKESEQKSKSEESETAKEEESSGFVPMVFE